MLVVHDGKSEFAAVSDIAESEPLPPASSTHSWRRDPVKSRPHDLDRLQE
jgi:hypothetical protein